MHVFMLDKFVLYQKVYFGSGGEDSDDSFALGSIIGSSLNAIQIQVMNVIYEKVRVVAMAPIYKSTTAPRNVLRLIL